MLRDLDSRPAIKDTTSGPILSDKFGVYVGVVLDIAEKLIYLD
jgi:hypothetical protein